jgi:hypothetical protein
MYRANEGPWAAAHHSHPQNTRAFHGYSSFCANGFPSGVSLPERILGNHRTEWQSMPSKSLLLDIIAANPFILHKLPCILVDNSSKDHDNSFILCRM